MRIIIVEDKINKSLEIKDQPAYIRELCRKLKREGFTVILCNDRTKLVDELKLKPDDVLLIDVHLEDDDDLKGIALAEEIRKSDSNVGIITWTGDPDFMNIVRKALIARETGLSVADSFISKINDGLSEQVNVIKDVGRLAEERIRIHKAYALKGVLAFRAITIASMILYVIGLGLGAWIWVHTVDGSLIPAQAQALTPLAVALISAAALGNFYNIVDKFVKFAK